MACELLRRVARIPLEADMKNVLVALVCTLGVVACGEKRQANAPSSMQTTSTTETTTARPASTGTPTPTPQSTPRSEITGPGANPTMSGPATTAPPRTAPP